MVRFTQLIPSISGKIKEVPAGLCISEAAKTDQVGTVLMHLTLGTELAPSVCLVQTIA